ncbi:MAG: 4Fe-4S dicluster domain-containing protein [Cyanobacteria bacterium SIG32]|nr:4Fe-4S dicluster domain-containing protein [Cyanobacteria bacterium SIG32]
MLKDILEQRKGFKLVCGAGNEDAQEVEKLVTIYSKAGCPFFDVCAKPEIVDAAKKGLKNAGIKENRYLCVSVGISGDPHITKAYIDQDKCKKCGKCKIVCPHNAIIELDKYKVKKERCLGCTLCAKSCPHNAITMEAKLIDYKEVLPELIQKGIDCIEFHAISTDEIDVDEKWEQINELYDGMLCISLDRSELGDKKLKARVERLIKNREPYSTIIQADGVAMSGNNDEFGTTLQAVATAQLFQNANMSAYIMMSGGTNTKSTELAKMCGVKPHCLAVGSYARKIVKEYLMMDDLLQNEKAMSEAVKIAKSLIDISLENMQND